MSAQLKIKEEILNKNTRISVSTETRNVGRPNIDHLLKRILVKILN